MLLFGMAKFSAVFFQFALSAWVTVGLEYVVYPPYSISRGYCQNACYNNQFHPLMPNI